MPKYVSILSRDAARYAELFDSSDIVAQHDIALDVVSTKSAALSHSKTQLLLGDPNLIADVLADLSHLQWCQSTYAGNRAIIAKGRKDFYLTGVKGVFSQAMLEYVLVHTLAHYRHLSELQTLQKDRTWGAPHPTTIKNKTLGIMGCGNIAHGMLDALQLLGLRVIALNTDGRKVFGYPKIDTFASEDKLAFAANADILLNLLPDTPQTQGFIDDDFVDAVPEHCFFINAGRGSVVHDHTLLIALNTGKFAHAVLDVFVDEPLPYNHPFWEHDRITITQHTAAISQPEWVFAIFEQNLQRFFLQAPLKYQVNWNKGY
jgi:phosphoglycerate dehydrogenase-like enzyme